MPFRYRFQNQIFDCVVGGVSALDIPRLNITDEDQALQFIAAYGYDLNLQADHDELWATHRRAVTLIQDHLLSPDDEPGEQIPAELSDPQQLTHLWRLLLLASDRSRDHEARRMQKWACAILRVMHVYTHLRHDLFSAFSDEIQSQILNPFQDLIVTDPTAGSVVFGKSSESSGVKLHKFDIKPFKTTASSVIKLLARPERVALTLLDKLGIRFVTKSVFDSFRVIRFLLDQHIISYPHIIPDQSNNTLYPLNLFLEVMAEMEAQSNFDVDYEAVELRLAEKFKEASTRAEFLEKYNEYSDPDYRFIKFINRKLITVPIGSGDNMREFRFFYPYEIQIMDYNTYVNNLSGPLAHDQYKHRQRLRARERVLGLNIPDSLECVAR